MTITGICYRFSMINKIYDHTIEGDIPFTGEERVLTVTTRDTHETTVKKCVLPEETINAFKALIDKYDVASWTGKTPAAPKVCDDGNTHQISSLTLKFDDGSSAEITFREVPEETGNEASNAFRKLFFESQTDDKKFAEEHLYPTLKECRGIKENHGPVVAVETSSFTSGMMMNSNVWYTQTIEKAEGKDKVLVTVKRKRGNFPEVSSSKETTSDILSKVQEISDRENIPGWNYACVDPNIPVDTSMRPTDYTAYGSINIYYDDSLISGCPRVKRTIGETACKMGGKEVDREITDMINSCVNDSGAADDLPDTDQFPVQNPEVDQTAMNGFLGMGMLMGMGAGIPGVQAPVSDGTGTWDCSCGAKGLTGKFCSNCGLPRP